MNDRQRSIHLSPVQIVASALASITAAVLASFFGVAGTVIGAGVVSAAASVGNAVYAYWIRSTHRAIRDTIPSALKQPGSTVRTLVGSGARVSGGSPGATGIDRADADAENTNEVPALDPSLDAPPPGPLGPPPSRLGRPPTAPGATPSPGGHKGRAGGGIEALWPAALRVARSLRWRNIALATVAAFGLSMAGVTAVEALANKPLSGIVGGSVPAGATTSLGGLVGGGQSSKPSPTSPSSPSETTTTNPQTTTPNGFSTTTTSPSSTTTTPGRSSSTTPSSPTSPSAPPPSSGTTPGSSGSSSGAPSSGTSSSPGASSSGSASGANPPGGASTGTPSAGG